MLKGKIKQLLRSVTSAKLRLRIKQTKRHLKRRFSHSEKISIETMRSALLSLGINRGDRLIVASSFGYLNADFSPSQLIGLLQELVGENGTIMMPYYPGMNSVEWAQKGLVFDMNKTKSGMGVLTNVFSKMPGVLMSKHPTKAVCVWGKDAQEIIQDHEVSTTPFYWDSPYGKLLKAGSKSLGLGLKNIPIFHSIEDILTEPYNYYYQKQPYKLHVIDNYGEDTVVETYVHDQGIIDRCQPAGDYTKDLNCKTYRRISMGLAFVYIIDNADLLQRCKEEFARGHSRLMD